MFLNLSKRIDSLKGKKILVIGDIMLDEYHWCTVQRISPEAPVPICRVKETTLVPGGAANVAHNIQQLDSVSILIGIIGKDSSGEKLKTLLNKKNISTDGLLQDNNRPTILKSRIIANQQHVVRVDRETTVSITKKQQNTLITQIQPLLKNCHAVLLSDYLKGTLTTSFCKKIIQLAHQEKKPVIVDPKGTDYSKYKGATLLTPNFKEFKAITKSELKQEKDIVHEAKKLIKKLKISALLITRSEKGMSLISNNEKIDIPTQAKEVYDITGAGDTVISLLTLAIAENWSFKDAAYIANFAAGIVVGKIGTSTTTLKDIQKELTKYAPKNKN